MYQIKLKFMATSFRMARIFLDLNLPFTLPRNETIQKNEMMLQIGKYLSHPTLLGLKFEFNLVHESLLRIQFVE